MTDPTSGPASRSPASIQAEIDAKTFEQAPLHIIERYLESFADDGRMTFPVPQHILETLAIRFRMLLSPGSAINSLDEAFGGRVARQQQARRAADQQYEVAFSLLIEMRRLQRMPPTERGPGTPFEIACEQVAQELNMSVDNVRRLYKNSKGRGRAASG